MSALDEWDCPSQVPTSAAPVTYVGRLVVTVAIAGAALASALTTIATAAPQSLAGRSGSDGARDTCVDATSRSGRTFKREGE